MTFISYAQNFEDVMLWRALKHIKQGFYIDVGACHPSETSVTKAFYDQGWSGINIEPVNKYYELLQQQRPRDTNLQLLVGNSNEEKIFYEIPETGLSTLDKAIAERHHENNNYPIIERKIPMQTLTQICKDLPVKDLHFVKIDVEGAEKIVLEGFDLAKIRPWIILIEATLPNTQEECYIQWESKLLENRYQFVYFDGLNRFYVAEEHNNLKAVFNCPPNFFDHFIKNDEYTLLTEKNRLYKENSNLHHENLNLHHENSNLHHENLNFHDENLKLRKKIEHFSDKLIQENRKNFKKDEIIYSLQEKIQKVEMEMQKVEMEMQKVEMEILNITNSKSWKMTAKFRSLLILTKKLKTKVAPRRAIVKLSKLILLYIIIKPIRSILGDKLLKKIIKIPLKISPRLTQKIIRVAIGSKANV